MLLVEGTRIGPYEIAAPLGAGGMGEVYRARDPRLGREVAIKILRSGIGDRRRFEIEARAASGLSHPNILAVYDVGEADGSPYIVTEFLEGQCLRDLLQGGGLPVRKLLDIAVQIAAGLATAHAQGVIHRDLKPENVMVLRSGQVKILDFGLAKTAGASADQTQTDRGMVVGTLAYMSPEQVHGDAVDYRSDQFSLGVILYEMATGDHPFRRADWVGTVSAIVREEPPPLASAAIPAPVRWVIERCLAKEPAARYSSTADLCEQLRDIRDHLSEAFSSDAAKLGPAPTARRLRRLRKAMLAAIIGLVALSAAMVAGAAIAWQRSAGALPRFTPFATAAADESEPAWSPDGRAIAYIAREGGTTQVFARNLDSAVAAQLTRAPSDCRYPFWMPDGSRICYRSAGKLWSVAAVGGASRELMPLSGSPSPGAAVSPAGRVLAHFVQDGRLFGVSLTDLPTGAATHYMRSPFPRRFRFPGGVRFSPDGRKLLVWLVPNIDTGPEVWLLPYPVGEPVRVETSLLQGYRLLSMNWASNSTIVYSTTGAPGTGSHLYLLDTESGRTREITSGISNEFDPAVSPDTERIAFATGDADSSVYEIALNGSRIVPLLATSRHEHSPDWSPNGRQFAYVTDAGGLPEIWIRDVEEGTARPIVQGNAEGHLGFARPRLSPDGQRITYLRAGVKHLIWISNLSGGVAVPLEQETRDQHSAVWSSDGAWIAYMRFKDDRWEIAKAPAGGGAQPVTVAPGGSAASQLDWSPGGDRILFTDEDGLFVVSAAGGAPVRIAAQTATFMVARDGSGVYLFRPGKDRGWELTKTSLGGGPEQKVASVDLPKEAVVGFARLHPDGTRFILSAAEWKRDIWLLDRWKRSSFLEFLTGR